MFFMLALTASPQLPLLYVGFRYVPTIPATIGHFKVHSFSMCCHAQG
jgi:hypothetical protein